MNLINNAKWNLLSQIFKLITQLINIVYLTKIIAPKEYGIMAMALVVMNLAILLRDLGTSAAIIQRKELNDGLINSIYWVNVLMGVSLMLIVALMSPVIANIYGYMELIPVLLILSLSFPISCSATTHLALLERESKFKLIAKSEITSSLVALIASITLAKFGFGVYSLVFQSIILSLISAILFWRYSDWRPKKGIKIRKKDVTEVFSFSANLSLFNFINYFSRNADSFIIGKFMSANILGQYNLAYRIMLFPLQSMTFVASRSLLPILSKQQDDSKSFYNTYIKTAFFILMISAPLMSGLAVLSDTFVYTVFGNEWSVTGVVLKWLAPTAIIQSILSTTGSVFTAKGRTDILMKLGLLGAILQVGSFLIGVHYDIITFAKLYMVANILNFIIPMYILFRVIGGSLISFLFEMKVIIISSSIMATCVYFIKVNLLSKSYAADVILLIDVFLGVLIYTILMTVFSKNFRVIIKRVLKK